MLKYSHVSQNQLRHFLTWRNTMLIAILQRPCPDYLPNHCVRYRCRFISFDIKGAMKLYLIVLLTSPHIYWSLLQPVYVNNSKNELPMQRDTIDLVDRIIHINTNVRTHHMDTANSVDSIDLHSCADRSMSTLSDNAISGDCAFKCPIYWFHIN